MPGTPPVLPATETSQAHVLAQATIQGLPTPSMRGPLRPVPPKAYALPSTPVPQTHLQAVPRTVPPQAVH